MKLCMTEPDFQGKFIPPRNWENGHPKMGQKQGFLNLLKFKKSLIFTEIVL